MHQKRWLYLPLGICLLVTACQKIDLPDPVGEDPVFSMAATIGGSALQLTAGENDYYLFTEFRKDDRDVFSFIGRFEKLADCTADCNEMLEFEIRDAQITAGNSTDINAALYPGIFQWYGTDTSGVNPVLLGYQVQFENQSAGKGNLDYFWDFGDNTTSTEASPNHFYPVSLNPLVPVTLLTTAADNQGVCVSVTSKLLNFNVLHTFNPCRLSYQVMESPTSLVSLCASMTGQPPFTYLWEIDSTYLTACTPEFYFNDSLFIRLNGTDAQGCAEFIDINLLRQNAGSLIYCSAAFDYEVKEKFDSTTNSTDSLYLSQVILRYRDSAGTLFQSTGGPVNSNDQFEIIEVSDFSQNENGEKTKKLSVRFSCTLYAQDGSTLEVKNGTGVIAVAYP